jgi:hypothetical protein
MVVVVVAGIVVVVVVGAVPVVVGTVVVVVVVLLAARVTPAEAANAAAGDVRLSSMAATVPPMIRGALTTAFLSPAEGGRPKRLPESSDTSRCRPLGTQISCRFIEAVTAGRPSKSPAARTNSPGRIEVGVKATPGPMNCQ